MEEGPVTGKKRFKVGGTDLSRHSLYSLRDFRTGRNVRKGSRPCENSRTFSHGPISFAFSSPETVQRRRNHGNLRSPRPVAKFRGVLTRARRILAVPDPLLEVRSPVLIHRSRRLRDRRHQWRWPKMLCAISRPIPQPNPCATDLITPAPCSGAKTAIAPTAKPARTIILTTMLLKIEAEETDRRGRRERAVRRRNMFAAPSPAAAAARSPRRPR